MSAPPLPPTSWPTPPPSGWAPARTDAPNAITALVLGILGLTLLPLVLSIPAIVVGRQAQRAAAAEPWRYTPDSARIAVILGWIGVAVGGLALLAFLAWLLFVVVLFAGAAGAGAVLP